MLSPAQHVAIAAIALLGGAVNAIAGGGMLLTFPALIGLGVPSLVANATSTVALWPASVASFLGYRAELTGVRAWALWFLAPSVAGGLLGGVLLTVTSQRRFDQIVPFLVLFATLLFLGQRPALDALNPRAFGLRGLTNIHQMNGLKNFCGLTFNLVAIGAFVVKGLVDWPIALTMALGSVLGGWGAAGVAPPRPRGGG